MSAARALTVGLVCQGWWPEPGGVEVHTRALARALVARGHRVCVLRLDRGEGLEPYAVRDGVVEGVEVRGMAAPPGPKALADLVADARADGVVLAWLADTGCELVHAHHLTGFGVGALRGIAAAGRALVLTLHDHWLVCPCGQLLHDPADPRARLECIRAHWPYLLPSGGGLGRGPDGESLADDASAVTARFEFVRVQLAHARVLLAPSRAALDAHACLGLERRRARVVEHGLDAGALALATRSERAAHPRLPGDPLRLGVLGAVLPGKGVAELMQAFLACGQPDLALEVHGPLVSFHGDARHLERVRALAQRSERISLHGAYSPAQLPGVLARLDAVAAPSLWDEVYGLSVREARAAGLPVLVSDRGGLPPAAQGGAAGRVLPAGDIEAWTQALRELAREGELRARWAAQPHTLRDVAAMTADHEEVYLEALRAAT